MARIYRLTDRIKYKIDDLTIEISPLDDHNKSTLQHLAVLGQSGDMKSSMQAAKFAMKVGLKSVDGVEYSDGEKFKLSFGEDGYVSDECIVDLLNMEESTKMIQVLSGLMNGVSAHNLPKGVSVVEDEKRPNGKKPKV